MRFWRPLVFAAAVSVVAGVGAATAQTVIVKNAPPGSHIELVLNSSTVGSATADSSGSATLVARQSAAATTEMDANIFVDVCGEGRRVLIVERTQPAPPPDAACTRREITGLFLVRPASTLVVDVGGPNPTLLLHQGRFTPAASQRTREPSRSPVGLVLFGGGDFTVFRDASAVACGAGANCKGDGSGLSYTAGVAYWFLPFLAADVTYVKSGEMTAVGSGDTYRFSNSLHADVLTIAGQAGAPIGTMRIYGKGGATYHRATFSTTETIDDSTITIDNVTQTIPGGTQTLSHRTAGWGWMFGGGMEAWLARWFGVYGEVGWVRLKGRDMDGGEAVMNDRLLTVQFGARVHIGR